MTSILWSATESRIDSLLRRDRVAILTGIAILTAAAWAYIIRLALRMGGMDMQMAMPSMHPWTMAEVLLLWAMWAIMMMAMMLPSAAPVILLFASLQRRRKELVRPYVPTAVFLGGYLLIWGLYSFLAALLQVALHQAALLSPAMASRGAWFGGGLLMAAALYQFTPLKTACLRSCRSPMNFLSTQWREGSRGALSMGIRHGGYCVGCCWVLMALLFVAGVMNLLWVASLAGLVLIEKLTPHGLWVTRVSGIVLLAAGAWLWATAL